MTTMTATDVSRGFSRVLDRVVHGGEEIIIIRNKQPVAKLIAGVPKMSALEALSDIYRTIDYSEGKAWNDDIHELPNQLDEKLTDPWA